VEVEEVEDEEDGVGVLKLPEVIVADDGVVIGHHGQRDALRKELLTKNFSVLPWLVPVALVEVTAIVLVHVITTRKAPAAPAKGELTVQAVVRFRRRGGGRSCR